MMKLDWILSASALILAIAAIRVIFRKQLTSKVRYCLWLTVLLRLLLPGTIFHSPWSAAQAATQMERSQMAQMLVETRVFSGVIRDTSMTRQDVETLGRGTIYESHGHPVETGPHGMTYLLQDTLRNLAARWLPRLWIAGVAVTGTVFLILNLRFYLLLRGRRRPVKIACSLPVWRVDGLSSSCLFVRSIYLSGNTIEDETKLHHVLAHEMSHYRHGDSIWPLLRCVAIALHWYNPLVWWAGRLSRRDSELFADAGALEELGEDAREEYGKTLIQLSAHCKGRLSPLYTATTMSSGKRALRERIIGIAQGKAHMTVRAALGLLLILGVCLSCAFTGATTEEPALESTTVGTSDEIIDLSFVPPQNGQQLMTGSEESIEKVLIEYNPMDESSDRILTASLQHETALMLYRILAGTDCELISSPGDSDDYPENPEYKIVFVYQDGSSDTIQTGTRSVPIMGFSRMLSQTEYNGQAAYVNGQDPDEEVLTFINSQLINRNNYYSSPTSELYYQFTFDHSAISEGNFPAADIRSMYEAINSEFLYIRLRTDSLWSMGHYTGASEFVSGYDFYPEFGEQTGYPNPINTIVQDDSGREYEMTPLKAMVINENVIHRFDQMIENGRNLQDADCNFRSQDDRVPVVLGNAYKSQYRLGDILSLAYLSVPMQFEVVGFLKQGATLSISHGVAELIELDSYIVIPALIPTFDPVGSSAIAQYRFLIGELLSGYIAIEEPSSEVDDLTLERYSKILAKLEAQHNLVNSLRIAAWPVEFMFSE